MGIYKFVSKGLKDMAAWKRWTEAVLFRSRIHSQW